MVGKTPLILLPAVFSVQWVPDGSHVNHTVLDSLSVVQSSPSGPALCFLTSLQHVLPVLAISIPGDPALDKAELLFLCPGAGVAATCAFCPVPVVVTGKLIHHGDACVFVGSSYRKVMDREIIQGKKKEGES